MRELQIELAALGMSSMGRAEGCTMASVNNVIGLTDRLLGQTRRSDVEAPCDHALGAKILQRNTREPLGAPRHDCAVRIMVTMPSEAAQDYSLVHDLIRNGMDCMRIDCAHDDAALWSAMIRHLRRACTACKRDCTILMDLTGPKIRTGPIEPGPPVVKIRPSRDAYGRVTKPARVLLRAKQSDKGPDTGVNAVVCVDDRFLAGLRRGHALRFLDTRGRRRRLDVIAVTRAGVLTELVRTAYMTNGTTLSRPGPRKHSRAKGDVRGIEAAAGTIALSTGDTLVVTSEPATGAPARLDLSGRVLRAARVSYTLPMALANVKVGERVSFDDGLISVADAAMSRRAECVLLDKRPHLLEALRTLDRMLQRTDPNQAKKSDVESAEGCARL